MNDYEELAKKLHGRIRATDQEYIICAANWYHDGKKYIHQPNNVDLGYVVSGRRHHNCFITFSCISNKEPHEQPRFEIEQGFLTSKDRWVNRKEAGEIAFKVGQTKELRTCLFSEDLY